MILDRSQVALYHSSLNTSFYGVQHTVSSPHNPIHQFRGIKYAIVPARFRQSILCSSYPPTVDATKFGCVSTFRSPSSFPHAPQAQSAPSQINGVSKKSSLVSQTPISPDKF